MSFGFSIGDFLAVGKLAIILYNACADAPAEFQELRRDLSSIHTVLYGLQSQAEDPTSLLRRRCDDRKPEWDSLKENLEGTLLELEDLLKRYRRMGRNAWKRVKFGLNDLSNLRGKLGVHLNSINTFVGSLSLSALSRMEPALGRIEFLLLEFVKDERLGNKAPTVLSAHEQVDGPAWKQMKLDLLLGGISKEDLERNEERIRDLLEWVVKNERDLVDLQEIEVGESLSQRQSFEEEVGEVIASSSRSFPPDGTNFRSFSEQSTDVNDLDSAEDIRERGGPNLQAPMNYGGPVYPMPFLVPRNEPGPPDEYQRLPSKSLNVFEALTKVATRENLEVNPGKIDIACAFVICDVTLVDCPIVYASDMFERLTGYSKSEVLGRNCRFLQSPSGIVDKDTERDDITVNYLRARIAANQEAQRNILNYDKSGQPFMNMLTVVPITGEDNTGIKYFVGFLKGLVPLEGKIHSIFFNDLYDTSNAAQLLGSTFNQPTVQQLMRREDPVSSLEFEVILDILNTTPHSRTDWNLFSQALEKHMAPLRTIKYTGQNAEPGMVENGDSSGQTRPSQVQNYSRPSNSRQRRYSSSATMLPTDFADGLLEYTINRVSKPVFNESSMLDSDLQEPMATTEQTDIQKRPARINSRLLNLMRQSDGFNANEMLLKFCFDQIFTGLTLDEIIRRLEVSQTSKNITRMRLDLLILAEYSNSHPQILNASDNQSDRLLSNLDSLLQVYKHQVWLSEQWDCSLPRQLRLNIINSHQYNCTVFTTVSLSQSMAKEMAVRAPRVAMRLLIIDHDFTHFGLLFEQAIEVAARTALLPALEGHPRRPAFHVHHFGVAGNGIYTAEHRKRIEKTKLAFTSNRIDGTDYPRMFHTSRDHVSNNYLQPYEYDFILLVPHSGVLGDNDQIKTPWSATSLFRSTLAGFDNFVDVLDLADDPSTFGSAPHRLKLPYRTGLFSGKQKPPFKEAEDQVKSCVRGFMRNKLQIQAFEV